MSSSKSAWFRSLGCALCLYCHQLGVIPVTNVAGRKRAWLYLAERRIWRQPASCPVDLTRETWSRSGVRTLDREGCSTSTTSAGHHQRRLSQLPTVVRL